MNVVVDFSLKHVVIVHFARLTCCPCREMEMTSDGDGWMQLRTHSCSPLPAARYDWHHQQSNPDCWIASHYRLKVSYLPLKFWRKNDESWNILRCSSCSVFTLQNVHFSVNNNIRHSQNERQSRPAPNHCIIFTFQDRSHIFAVDNEFTHRRWISLMNQSTDTVRQWSKAT